MIKPFLSQRNQTIVVKKITQKLIQVPSSGSTPDVWHVCVGDDSKYNNFTVKKTTKT